MHNWLHNKKKEKNVKIFFYCYLSGSDLLESIVTLGIAIISHDHHNDRHVFVNQSQGAVLKLSSQNAFRVHVCYLLNFLQNALLHDYFLNYDFTSYIFTFDIFISFILNIKYISKYIVLTSAPSRQVA